MKNRDLTEYLWEAYLNGDRGLVMTDHGQGDGEAIYELTEQERKEYGVTWSHANLVCFSTGERVAIEATKADIVALEKENEELSEAIY